MPKCQISIAKDTDGYTIPEKYMKMRETKGQVQDGMESRVKLLRMDSKGIQKRQKRVSTDYSPELQTIISNCLVEIFTWIFHR